VARDWALFLHLVGVLFFVGASAAVTALRVLALAIVALMVWRP
jgi:hypothetical protein